MPINTQETSTLNTERYISRIDIRGASVTIYCRTTKTINDEVISSKTVAVSVAGDDMLELVGISPRVEVPAGMNYYEAVRDRCYDYLNINNLWDGRVPTVTTIVEPISGE